jgi:N-acetylglucosamine kinase-like BadF-type ATPase
MQNENLNAAGMGLLLAVDAGGTKASYLLADGERELGRVRGGSIKRMRVPAETAVQHLEEALAELSALTGRSLAEVGCTCIGTAGNTVPLVTDWLRAEFGRRVGGKLLLLGDVEIALDAAFPGQPGILVLAGTGSNVMGRSAAGELVGAGGYGPALADQGSGHRIGEQALRALFLARDEGRSTCLYEAILAATHQGSYSDLVVWANSCPQSEFSPLAQVVNECAEAGDAVALSVLEKEGEELAELALLIHRRLKEIDGAAWKPRFAFAGSILENVRTLRAALIAAVEREAPGSQFLPGVIDPLQGALWRARQYAADCARTA